ncbi:hypothetical protein HN51_003292 [Arachis hypogaea]|uniref:Aldose 1-epimerase n=2 Tax=Arachis TaxID=3817 RepID=A0A445EJA4_ARAHY|nr:uncharacterized protein LOC107471733 [Arachis duranensis]XP_025681331.1 aldose 1-epimerase [Arachis hypogaea]QHO51652.1 Aldose 1-epimerase [Arachis hypogaea]RYR75518.1 hypothetical protein Ahy_A01g000060 [Arachis hypogaea]
MAKVSMLFSFLLGLVLLSQAHGSGEKIGFYELRRGDFEMRVTNYGATVLSVVLPDRNGNLADVVLGYDSIKSYVNDTTYFGGLIGRVANRIGHAEFTLDGKTYKLPANDHGNTLHGGFKGFNNVIWTVTSYKRDSHITFHYNSYDNEQGFPGKLEVDVTYMLMDTNKLVVKMIAKAIDKDTPVNLAQHTYWNMRGHNTGDVLSHRVQIFASKITPVNKKLIPTGKLQSVQGTPYDFRRPKEVGKQIDDLPGLYDINFAVDRKSKKHLNKVAVVRDPVSGRQMELWSNQVGVQFYTSGMLNNTVGGKDGAVYKKHAGIALETQGFPDSVNHPNFPSQIVRPGQIYQHYMVYRFTAY